MFNHARMKQLISAYIDGEVSAKEKMLVEEHLRNCVQCKQYWESLQKVSIHLKHWNDEEISPDLEQGIRSRFLGQKSKGGTMKKTKLFIGVTSGALVTLLVFGLVGSMHLRRTFQGKLQVVGDQIGEPYSPGVDYEKAGYLNKKGYDKDYTRRVNSLARGFTGVDGGLNAPAGAKLASYKVRAASGPNIQPSLYSAEAQKTASVMEYETSEGSYASGQEGPIVIVEPYLPATGTEEKLIRTADVNLEVRDVETVYDQILTITKNHKGYLAQVSFNEHGTGKINARLTLRVPKESFEVTLEQIRKLGRVKTFAIQSVDVSTDYARLVTELNTLKVVYDKIAEKLKEKKTTIDNAIRLESELSPVARRLAAIKNQIAQYDNLIAMSTITVELNATNWKLLIQENLKEAKERLVNLFADCIRGAIDLIPAAITILLLFGTGFVAILLILAVVKRIIRKKSS
jgi:hypothetical protein